MQITAEQFRGQYAKNAAQLRSMLAKAQEVAPKKYRGYTAEHLAANVAKFECLATLTDAALLAHIASVSRA